MNGKIYKVTNLINGKIYIGQTVQSLETRRAMHNSRFEPTMPISMAIKKYGKENFSWEILEDKIRTREKLNEREIYWIEYFGSYGNGYNATPGGGQKSNDSKRKVIRSDGEIYESTWEAIRKMGGGVANTLSGRSETAYGYGWKYLDESDGKPWNITLDPAFPPPERIYRVGRFGRKKYYNSINQAARDIGKPATSIYRALNHLYKDGSRRKCKGFEWYYAEE